MEKVAVITPAFNALEFVGECIRSVEKSVTLGRFEVEHVVVDDGSTDGTKEALVKMDRPALQLVFLDKNHGPGYARNVGVEAASAQWLFFLDADDILFGNSLRRLHEVATEMQANWIYGDFLRGDEEGKYLVGEDYYGWEFRSIPQLLYSMYSGKHFFQQNSLYNKDAIEKVGAFDAGLRRAEDFDLATRLLFVGIKPVYVPGPLYMHRYHDKNLSKAHLAGHHARHKQNVLGLYEKYKQRLGKVLSERQVKEVEKFVGGA